MKHIPSVFPISSFRKGELTVLPLVLCINAIIRFLDADVLYVFGKILCLSNVIDRYF